MKTIKSILASLALVIGLNAMAAECEVSVSVAPITDGDKVPASINDKMVQRLKSAMSRAGVVGSDYESQFFLAAKFDNAFFDVTGVDTYTVTTTLTVYIGDADGQKVFASHDFELKGYGNSEERAYVKALNNINGNNRELINFIKEGKDKIIEFFDNNYNSYLTKARKAMESRQYDEALYWALCVPECCKGFQQAQDLALQIYGHQVNYQGDRLLAQARAAWATNPNAEGAEEASSLLAQIDPGASCYPQAQDLTREIQKTVRADYDFETRQKYQDALELEKQRMANSASLERQRIAAARDIAVAYAQSRPRTVNRYYFIR